MALCAQYPQRIANAAPHTKSAINRLYTAFIDKTKAENAKPKNKMPKNMFIKKIIAPILTTLSTKPFALNYVKVFKIIII